MKTIYKQYTYKQAVTQSQERENNERHSRSIVGMGGTENFVHGIYREKIPRYRVYRGTCFLIVVTKVKQAQQSNWRWKPA